MIRPSKDREWSFGGRIMYQVGKLSIRLTKEKVKDIISMESLIKSMNGGEAQ